MITAHRVDERGHVLDRQPPPSNYPQYRSYTKQLFVNAGVVVVLAVLTVMAGLSLVGISL
ncbi:MAG: hypothetical protein ACXVYI_08590 [Mycobacterium sp.]